MYARFTISSFEFFRVLLHSPEPIKLNTRESSWNRRNINFKMRNAPQLWVKSKKNTQGKKCNQQLHFLSLHILLWRKVNNIEIRTHLLNKSISSLTSPILWGIKQVSEVFPLPIWVELRLWRENTGYDLANNKWYKLKAKWIVDVCLSCWFWIFILTTSVAYQTLSNQGPTNCKQNIAWFWVFCTKSKRLTRFSHFNWYWALNFVASDHGQI